MQGQSTPPGMCNALRGLQCRSPFYKHTLYMDAGAEIKVLKGATKVLQEVTFVLLEVSTVKVHTPSPSLRTSATRQMCSVGSIVRQAMGSMYGGVPALYT